MVGELVTRCWQLILVLQLWCAVRDIPDTPYSSYQADSDMKKLAAAESEANEIIKAARDERIQRIADAKQSAQEKLRVIEEENEKVYNDQKEMVCATRKNICIATTFAKTCTSIIPD